MHLWWRQSLSLSPAESHAWLETKTDERMTSSASAEQGQRTDHVSQVYNPTSPPIPSGGLLRGLQQFVNDEYTSKALYPDNIWHAMEHPAANRGRLLTKLLRQPESDIGRHANAAGWVEIQDIVSIPAIATTCAGATHLHFVVNYSPANRLELKFEGPGAFDDGKIYIVPFTI